MKIRINWFSQGSKISGCASVLGSWQICHNVCTSLIAALATFGIAIHGMPLLFLNKFQWPLWIAAVALFGVVLTIRLGARMRCITTRGIFGNTGLLLAGFPFAGDWVSGAHAVGLLIVLGVLGWYLKGIVVKPTEQGIVLDFVTGGKKIVGGLVGAVAVVALLTISRNTPIVGLGLVPSRGGAPSRGGQANPALQRGQSEGRMKFTLFDVVHAKELMDKNGDGKCDACGMPIDQCIESGMMQCTMDPQAKIGLLGSQHIHADWKIYIKGKSFDWSSYADLHERQMRGDTSVQNTSAFIHIHPAQAPEHAGDVLHMHATGVPLSLFFKSIDIKLPPVMKAYVNDMEISDYQNYVFYDGDKILITDGVGDVKTQRNSITDFARNH